MAKKSEKQLSANGRFPARVRFNWGFHDAASAGPKRASFLLRHFDPAYLAGSRAGFYAVTTGESIETSDAAWAAYRAGRS